jgi:hypothetical protein
LAIFSNHKLPGKGVRLTPVDDSSKEETPLLWWDNVGLFRVLAYTAVVMNATSRIERSKIFVGDISMCIFSVGYSIDCPVK